MPAAAFDDAPMLLPALEPTAVKQEPIEEQPEARKISAYYSLVFPNYTFYIQTLSITIGRRCNTNSSHASSSSSDANTVDVDLGALKSVSRLHAKIEYDSDEDRFVLVVISRNGAWVDGVWSGSGTRAPLGERSQIQISSRIFHFVLPPPPPPEDTPSPSSGSSFNRPRSPSVDITSFSPPSSPAHTPPPPRKRKLSQPPPEPEIPPPPVAAKTTTKPITNGKKRKKSEQDGPSKPIPPVERPKPEDIPPKPSLTYTQLIYRAIKAIGGKASLQEICTYIMKEHEYYRYADGTNWMSSVRHTLSGHKAFKKLERCSGEKGKGFYWSVDEAHLHILEEQDTKAQNPSTTGKEKGRKKDKIPLEPALKRSVKGDFKGPLPPPLTSTPLAFKTATVTTTQGPGVHPTSMTTGVFSYQSQSRPVHIPPSTSTSSAYSSQPMNVPNPYAALTQSHWVLQRNGLVPSYPATSSASPTPAVPSAPQSFVLSTSAPSQTVGSHTTTTVSPSPAPASFATPVTVTAVLPAPAAGTQSVSPPVTSPTPIVPSSTPTPASAQPGIPDVVIPIMLGPIPPTHPDYSPSQPNNSARKGYMILHERTIILCPDIFAALTKEDLTQLEKKGARQALQELTVIMVKELKERRAKRKKMKNRTGKPGATGKKAVDASASPAPSRDAARSSSMNVDPPAASTGRAESPILIIDDDEDEPATKRRKVDDSSHSTSPIDVVS